MDGNFTGLSSQILWINLIAIQIVSYFLADRSFLIGSSLIINIVATCFPGKFISVLGELFITLYIFDIF